MTTLTNDTLRTETIVLGDADVSVRDDSTGSTLHALEQRMLHRLGPILLCPDTTRRMSLGINVIASYLRDCGQHEAARQLLTLTE